MQLVFGIVLLLLGVTRAIPRQVDESAWQYNSPHYSNAQYVSIMQKGGFEQEPYGPFQYQYVDYQPDCLPGGPPVCATDGKDFYYFENACKLDAQNIQLIFKYGTELEATELERCQPNCDKLICTTRYEPVCAAVSGRGKNGITFANECEVQRHECFSKQSMRILNRGPCKQKAKGKPKKSRPTGQKLRKQRQQKSNSTSNTTEPPHIYFMLASSTSKPGTTTTTARTTAATPKAVKLPKFRQYVNNKVVSVSRAVDAYNVYNIDDVGKNYGAITDSTLSVYVPGVGTITDAKPSTTTEPIPSSTSTTTTTTIKPATTTTPSYSSTACTLLPSSTEETTTAATSAAPTSTAATTPSRPTTVTYIFVPYPVTSSSSSTESPSTTPSTTTDASTTSDSTGSTAANSTSSSFMSTSMSTLVATSTTGNTTAVA